MLSTISGAAVIGVTAAGYWYLLPRNGEVHPLVRNSDVGSMVTIAIMALLTFGIALLGEGIFG